MTLHQLSGDDNNQNTDCRGQKVWLINTPQRHNSLLLTVAVLLLAMEVVVEFELLFSSLPKNKKNSRLVFLKLFTHAERNISKQLLHP